MAINDPNYRYATQTWEADGIRTQYEIAFDGGYIRQSDVVAFSVTVDADTGLTTDRNIHALTFLSETEDSVTGWKTAQVTIEPAVPTGRRVVIFRSTEKSEPMVEYSDGSILTSANLDLANDQAIMGIAEIMDGLQAAKLSIDQQVQEVIDLNELIRSVYEQVLELLAAGGIVSVAPRVWFGEGDGLQTDFDMEGADVDKAAFYDTYIDGVGMEPLEDYDVVLGDDILESSIRFSDPVPDGLRWFTVLRGYARPSTDPSPDAILRPRVIDVPEPLYFIGEESEYGLLRASNNTTADFRVKEIPLVGEGMETGSYVSIVQKGSAQVVLTGDTSEVHLEIPAGYRAATRAFNSVISITCEFGDGNMWIVSGDLAKE